MTYHVVSSGGIEIACETEGEGSSVLLIHGFGANRTITWRNTGWFDLLTRAGHRVIALDCRGHGQSAKPHSPEVYDDRYMAGDAFAVLQQLEVSSADVIGYSMGAQLAIRLMHAHSPAVRRCVLGGLGQHYFVPTPEINETIADALERDDPEGISFPLAREFRTFCERAGDDMKAMAACMRRPRRIIQPEELRVLPQPVLVVCGAEDDLAGSPEPLARAFAHGQSNVVPKRNHHSTVGDRGFKDAVLQFFAKPD